MIIAEIRAERDKLKALISAAQKMPSDTDSAVASMAYEYLCVAVCGRIEQDVKKVLIEYSKRQTKAKLDRAVSRLCQNFINPYSNKLLDVIDLFDRDFKKELESNWEKDGSVGKVINSMVGQRKRIAHQTSSSRHTTETSVLQYFAAYEQLISVLEEHFLQKQ